MAEACFKGKVTLSCDDFAHIIDHIDSGMFLCILSLLRTHFPSFSQFKRYDTAHKKSGDKLLRPSSMGRKIASPRHLSKFTSVSGLARSSSIKNFKEDGGKSPASKTEEPKTTAPGKTKKEVPKSKFSSKDSKESSFKTEPATGKDSPNLSRGANTSISLAAVNSSGILPAIRLPNAKENLVDVTKSPSHYLGTKRAEEPVLFCQCGRQITNFDVLQCDVCMNNESDLKLEGCLCTRSKKTGKLKKAWYVVEKKEMYCYAMQTDKAYKKMRSLMSCFIKEELPEKTEEKIMIFPFTIVYTNALSKKYYAESKIEYVKWCDTIKQMIGYSNLTDYYDIKEVLGQGKFGVVKVAIHKKSTKRVAVKMLKKSTMGEKDLELVRNEIETLKMCQHPNIIKLLDIFENVEFIYIVTEILEGGDLFAYLEKRKFAIPEARARKIIHSLAAALFYMHSYGIVHRDIKPENIMMQSKAENSEVKIVDLGLAKMIGPTQLCAELYGTLAYVAPEVLEMKQYGKAVDIWSLGIIAHLLLVGFLPFDNEDDTVVAKLTIKAEVSYDRPEWKKVTGEGIDFVKKIILKDPSKRMTLKDILQHPWILKESKEIGEIRKHSLPGEAFSAFSLVQPEDNK